MEIEMTPTESALPTLQGSYLTPRFDEARVYDAMRKGIFTCSPDTPLRDVARIMATQHIHCVVVTGAQTEEPWGVISDLDLARFAATDVMDRTAGEAAATEVVTVTSDDRLALAARLMTEHDIAHLVVLHAETGKPAGVVSTLDVAGVIAWGEG
jgi:CBS domain-containing protein